MSSLIYVNVRHQEAFTKRPCDGKAATLVLSIDCLQRGSKTGGKSEPAWRPYAGGLWDYLTSRAPIVQ